MKKRVYNNKILGFIFAGLGIILIITGLVITITIKVSFNKFIETAIKTNAVISDIQVHRSSNSDSDTHDVFVSFTTEDNEEIIARLNYWSSGMYIGKSIEIYYDPLNPQKIKTNSSLFDWIFLLTFGCVGLVFFIIGTVFIIKSYRVSKQKNMLIEAGYSIMADVIEVYQDYSVRVNGRHPFIIQCKYSEWDKNYLFESGRIFFDPTHFINGKIRVWVDRNDYSNYYVDLDKLIDN